MYKNYLVLSRHISELNEKLAGSKIVEAYTQEKNVLVLMIKKEGHEFFLEICVEQNFPYLVLKEGLKKAKKNTIGFFTDVLPATINHIQIVDGDRIIRIKSDVFSLLFIIRGKTTNVLLTENDAIRDAFKTISPAEVEKLNKELKILSFVHRYCPCNFGEDAAQLYDYSSAKKLFPFLSRDVYEQIVLMQQLEPGNAFTGTLKELVVNLYSEAIGIVEDKKTGEVKLLPCSFNNNNESAINSFDNVNDALLLYIRKQFSNKTYKSLLNTVQKHVLNNLESLSNRINNLRNRIDEGSKDEEYYKSGNLLLIHMNSIPRGVEEIELEDIYDNNSTVKIRLKNNLSIKENVDYYFNKAKAEKTGYEKAQELYKNALEKYNHLINTKEKIENADSIEKIKVIMDELNIKQGSQSTEVDDISKKFKHYIVENKYHVFAGKDSKNNDLLTLKFAKQNDYWFHARSVSGSHVVLRVENTKEAVPKNVLKKAASIAAYHSKAKTSGTVPVSFTLKKYVVKRKGLDVGQVSLLKENVLLVKPCIPDGCEFVEQ